MHWFSGFEQTCRTDVPLRDHTWYGLGGPARWFCQPRDESELTALLARIRDVGIRWRVLGRGANLIIPDAGFDGAVIRLSAPAFGRFAIEDECVWAGAGVDFQRLVLKTLRAGRVGLEVLAGIPGTFGGIIRMNAGGRYGEIRDFVQSVRLLDRAGNVNIVPAEHVRFAYRRTELDGCVVLGAALGLQPGAVPHAVARYREIWHEKYNAQPSVSKRSAGCIFKNPPGVAAGRLLDQAGLKSARVGGAQISERHANFIVADRRATARDVLSLIDLARRRVLETSGVQLELEVEVWS
jgi:UDP-N-acetylmuramate dehydrogenase